MYVDYKLQNVTFANQSWPIEVQNRYEILTPEISAGGTIQKSHLKIYNVTYEDFNVNYEFLLHQDEYDVVMPIEVNRCEYNKLDLSSFGKANQSSLYEEAVATLAIDGNNVGIYDAKTCSHTHDKESWWQVLLDQPYLISHIKIYNRADCCGWRLVGANVTILKNETDPPDNGIQCGVLAKNGDIQLFYCPQQTSGMVVRIQQTLPEYLALCEVEVFGKKEFTCDEEILSRCTGQNRTCNGWSRSCGECWEKHNPVSSNSSLGCAPWIINYDCWEGKKGLYYRGPINHSEGGHKCQAWSSQVPHAHNIDHTSMDNTYDECRIPPEHKSWALAPFCITTDQTVISEYCDIPECRENFCEGTHQVNGTKCESLRRECIIPTGQCGGCIPLHYGSNDTTSMCKNACEEGEYLSVDCKNRNRTCILHQDQCGQCIWAHKEVGQEYCEPMIPNVDCWLGERGRYYVGGVNVSFSGTPCQAWEAKEPHVPIYKSYLTGNQCSNEHMGFEQPWCYTLDPYVQAEYCDVPPCIKRDEDQCDGANLQNWVTCTNLNRKCDGYTGTCTECLPFHEEIDGRCSSIPAPVNLETTYLGFIIGGGLGFVTLMLQILTLTLVNYFKKRG